MDAAAIRQAVEAAVAQNGEIQDSDRIKILNEALKGSLTAAEVTAARQCMRDAYSSYSRALSAFVVAERGLDQARSINPPNPIALDSARRDHQAAYEAREKAQNVYNAFQLVAADFTANQGYSNFGTMVAELAKPKS